MAAALPGADVPVGLATDPWIRDDLVEPAYDSSAGSLETAAWQGRPPPRVLENFQFRTIG